MSSSLKFIAESEGHYDAPWRHGIANTKGDMFAYVRTLSVNAKLRFMFDQALACSYFFYIYGSSSHLLVTSYSKDLAAFVAEFENTETVEGTDKIVLQTIKNIIETWYGYGWIDVDIDLAKNFLYDLSTSYVNPKEMLVPYGMQKRTTIPYLMQRNKLIKQGYTTWGETVFPSFRFSTIGINGNYDAGLIGILQPFAFGRAFYADINDMPGVDRSVLDAMNDFARHCYTFLSMLCKLVLSGERCETALRILAGMSLHRDQYAEVSANQRLFYAADIIFEEMYRTDFIEIFSAYGADPFERPSHGVGFDAYVVMRLIMVLNKTQGLKFKDRDLFIRFFGLASDKDNDKNNHDLKQIVEFVETSGTSVASAEAKEVFMSSPLGSCEAIDLISQRIPVRAQESGADKTEDEPEEEEENDKLDLSDLPEREDAEPGLEADDVSPEEEDTSTDDDEGTDDSSSQGGDDKGETGTEGGTDDDNADNANSSGDTNSGTDDAGASSATSTVTDTQTASATPEDIDASDSLNEVPFKISPEGSETVDSVVLREELDEFVSEILVNPPKKLSPQTIRALTDLQKYWIHILSVETITGILGALIALPDKFKSLTSTHGENS